MSTRQVHVNPRIRPFLMKSHADGAELARARRTIYIPSQLQN